MQTAMLEPTEAVCRAHGIEMRIRVGLNSGDVVVHTIGNGLHMDYSAVGQTTHPLAMASEINAPMLGSLLAEMVPTWAMSCSPRTSRLCERSSRTTWT
jgi:class 3 adenylate cyclase